jgi:hypothetical protein
VRPALVLWVPHAASEPDTTERQPPVVGSASNRHPRSAK